MRADRLLALLVLLQARGRVTARALAERLEVSERTIYRDVSALGSAGVPIYAERGPGGGVCLLDGYRTSLTGLSEAEVRTLFVSSVPGPLADLGLGNALEPALLKLLAALPSAHRDDAQRARQRIHLDAAPWSAPDEAVTHLGAIQDAVWRDRRLRLIYRRAGGALVERLVDPLGLVAKASVWYLVAAVEGELRVYRVSRVQAAELVDEPCQRPEGFDLAATWAELNTQFRASWDRYPVTLRVSPELARDLPQIYGESVQASIEQAGPPDGDGWLTLSLGFDSPDVALARVAGFGTRAEVIAPRDLREQLITHAARLVAFYAERDAYALSGGETPPSAGA